MMTSTAYYQQLIEASNLSHYVLNPGILFYALIHPTIPSVKNRFAMVFFSGMLDIKLDIDEKPVPSKIMFNGSSLFKNICTIPYHNWRDGVASLCFLVCIRYFIKSTYAFPSVCE